MMFPAQGVPHWQVKSSGIRQSKIYRCQLALMGRKGLNDVAVNPLPPKELPIDE